MLDAEGNADDGDEIGDGAGDVTYGQPDSSEDEPDDVPNGAQGTGADVIRLMKLAPAYRFLAEREERELAHDETGFAPRDADDRNAGDDPRQPPRESHKDPTKDEPEEIEDRAHGDWL